MMPNERPICKSSIVKVCYHAFMGLYRFRKLHPLLNKYPVLVKLVEQCRQRIIEVELKRSDMPSAATPPAMALSFAGGLDTFVTVLAAFCQEDFVRGHVHDSRGAVFSHLLRVTFPQIEDTSHALAEQVAQVNIPVIRLVEAAVYAPQWARHIEGS